MKSINEHKEQDSEAVVISATVAILLIGFFVVAFVSGGLGLIVTLSLLTILGIVCAFT